MKEETRKAVITGIIGLVATIIGSIISAIISANVARKNATEEVINQIENGVANLNGDNANIIINDIDDFISDYEELKIQNEGLNALNTQYSEQISANEAELKSLREQLGDAPDIKYYDLGLAINGENVPINANNSMVSINGRDYLSKEFTDNILAENEGLTIKDGTAYIGRIISDQSNLFDKWVVDSAYFVSKENVTDNYGNKYIDILMSDHRDGYIIYNLNNEYSLLKLSISVSEKVSSYSSGIITIMADDTVVYTSSELTKTTAPFEITDIPINNCSLLRIECDAGYYGMDCIISDAVVYN